jgi:D-alanyl-D-alanine carboxypeptidase
MKTVKINKTDYVNLQKLLTRVGAVDDEKQPTAAYPSNVYWTKQDLAKMTRALMAEFKKQYPYVRTKKLKSSVGMHMLNLSPSEVKGVGLKQGYMLVDERGIASEKEARLHRE